MTKTEYILLGIIAGLMIERTISDRFLSRLLRKNAFLQTVLFESLENSYNRVEASHVMTMRALQVAETKAGTVPAEEEAIEDEEWPGVVGEGDK